MRSFRCKRLQIEAATWIARLPSATAEEKALFLEWVKSSKDHVRELLLADIVACALADLRNARRHSGN